MRFLFIVFFGFLFTNLACAERQSAAEPSFVVLTKTSSTWDGSDLPDFPSGKPEITILKVVVPPGAKVPWHKHPGMSAAYILEGEISVYADSGKTIHLKAGDSVVEVVDKWHFGENNGPLATEIVVLYLNEAGQPLSISKKKTH